MKALLVIDAQESFRQRPSWALTNLPDIGDRIARLVEHARAIGTGVIWIFHSEPGSGGVFDPESGFIVPLSELEILPDEPIFTKTAHNALSTTGLAQYLTRHGITELQISGIRTEQCCETTTRVASDFGYSVDFILDATATHPIEHWAATPGRSLEEIIADPLTLTADQIVQRTAYALAGRFARILTLEEALQV